MAHIYLNFSRVKGVPWAITVTNADRTEMISQTNASELEVNVFCKTFVGKFHYKQRIALFDLHVWSAIFFECLVACFAKVW